MRAGTAHDDEDDRDRPSGDAARPNVLLINVHTLHSVLVRGKDARVRLTDARVRIIARY